MSSALMGKISPLIPSRHIRNQFPYENFPKYQIKLDTSLQFSRNHCCPHQRDVFLSAADSPISASEVDHIEPDRMPNHIAFTPDGHRRWSKSRNIPLKYGYRELAKGTKKLAIKCSQLGVQVLTVFFFSTNNWDRPEEEVELFMSMTEDMLRWDIPELTRKYGIRTDVIGDKSRLPKSLQSVIATTEESSKRNSGMHLLIGMGYGGRNDIIQATKNISRKVSYGIYEVDHIDETILDQHLYTSCIEVYKCPDLCIRTAGEMRSSDFMLYQTAYSEMYFSNKLFPEFGDGDLLEAIRAFQKRDRRFGGKKFEHQY